MRQRGDYARMEASNAEKRVFTLPLPPSPDASPSYRRFLDEASAAVVALRPVAPDLAAYAPVDPEATHTCGRFRGVRLSPSDGSLTSLIDAASDKQWVAPGGALGSFAYRTYTEWVFNRCVARSGVRGEGKWV